MKLEVALDYLDTQQQDAETIFDLLKGLPLIDPIVIDKITMLSEKQHNKYLIIGARLFYLIKELTMYNKNHYRGFHAVKADLRTVLRSFYTRYWDTATSCGEIHVPKREWNTRTANVSERFMKGLE